MKLLVVLTGGSIDSDPALYTGESVFSSPESPALGFLISTYGDDAITEVTICQKDSKDVNAADITKIVAAVTAYQGEDVLILLGTDAMEIHSKIIADALHNMRKTVRITGAMLPLGAANSDAVDNLNFAIADMHTEKYTTKVVMAGEVFIPGKFYKDKEAKKFVQV